MQRFGDAERLLSDRHFLLQVSVVEVSQRREQHAPTVVPFRQQLVATDSAREELGVAVAPRFLAVGRQKVREARAKIARDVPDDRGDRVARAGGVGELRVVEL